MKTSAIFAGACLLGLQVGAPAWAEETVEKNEWHGMMSEQHGMHQETLKMLKDLMAIVRTINHKVSDADQARLKTMEERLDKIIAREDEMMKSHSMMHEKGKGMMMEQREKMMK
ncbi:MAG: hypothetical protein AB1810_00640 [Pseudomonadota bacterium]